MSVFAAMPGEMHAEEIRMRAGWKLNLIVCFDRENLGNRSVRYEPRPTSWEAEIPGRSGAMQDDTFVVELELR